MTLQGEIFFLAFLCTYCYSTLDLCPQNHYLLPSLSRTKKSPCLIGEMYPWEGNQEPGNMEWGFLSMCHSEGSKQ